MKDAPHESDERKVYAFANVVDGKVVQASSEIIRHLIQKAVDREGVESFCARFLQEGH